MIDNIYVRFGSYLFRQVIGLPMGTNYSPLLADLFFTLSSMTLCLTPWSKKWLRKAIQLSNTFWNKGDLFSVNNEEFGDNINTIYPKELKLKDTSTSSTEVCYPDARIGLGDNNSPFHVRI